MSTKTLPPKKPPKPKGYGTKKISPPKKPPKPYGYRAPPTSYYDFRGLPEREKASRFSRWSYANRLEQEYKEKKRKEDEAFRNKWQRNGYRLNEERNKSYRKGKRAEIHKELKKRIFAPDYQSVSNKSSLKDESSFEGSFEVIDPNKISIPQIREKPKKRTFKNLFRRRRKVGGAVSIMKKQSVKKRRNSPMYKGLGYDMLMAYVYLIKKYRDTLCIAIGDKTTLKGTFDPTYVGLVYERKQGKNDFTYHGGIRELSEFIKKCKKRFFAIPLSIEYPDSGPHFNILIGDNETKVIERFEPYGAYLDEKVHESLDRDFKMFLKNFGLDFTYKNPDEFCPASGFQEIEENNIQKKKASVRRNDYRGYCGMWSVWFIEMKMRNPDLPSDKLLKKALKEMQRLKSSKNQKFTYRKFVRNYKDHIIEIRNGIIKEGGIECGVGEKSPNYSTFQRCAKLFMDKKLDEFF